MAECQCNSDRTDTCTNYTQSDTIRPASSPWSRTCGSYDAQNSQTNYIEYWKCPSYVFYDNNIDDLNSISSTIDIIDNRFLICNNHSSWKTDPGGACQGNEVREGWTYINGNNIHSPGYRDKNDDRNLDLSILNSNKAVLTRNFISADWINALSTSLSTEICARLQNYLYSNKIDEVNELIDGQTPNQCIVDGDFINRIRTAMNLLSSGVMSDTGANLQPVSSVIPNSKDIQTLSSIIAKTEVRKFISDCNIAYKDCICYSDCGGYAVCFCYGNCNYY